MSADLVALLYLVSGVLFILALRGLSSPETARQGNNFGMAGMALAILTTLAVVAPRDATTWAMIVGGLALGGGIGAVTARRIAMTAMPQLVAAIFAGVPAPTSPPSATTTAPRRPCSIWPSSR